VTYESGGPWEGSCTESVGQCRTTQGVVFVSTLWVYHVCCVLYGMYMCYKVWNLPSIMDEGKWVFTGFYTQLQVFVTAVPVLIMVKKNYLTSTIMKSLVICVGDLTTLAMVFVPKMLLVYKYSDFGREDVSEYVASSTLERSSASVTLYDRLRLKKPQSASIQPLQGDVEDEPSESSNGPIYEHFASHLAAQAEFDQIRASGVGAAKSKIALQVRNPVVGRVGSWFV